MDGHGDVRPVCAREFLGCFCGILPERSDSQSEFYSTAVGKLRERGLGRISEKTDQPRSRSFETPGEGVGLRFSQLGRSGAEQDLENAHRPGKLGSAPDWAVPAIG